MNELFKNIDQKTVEKIYGLLPSPIKMKKGENIYKCGYIGILESGKAMIFKNSVLMRSLNVGDFFGCASLFGKWSDEESKIISKSECTVLYISENNFLNIISKCPQISLNYIKYLTEKIKFLNQRIDTFTAKSTANRLYDYLLSNADNNGFFEFQFSITELAKRLNVGRTSLYRDIKTLENKNLIIRNKNGFKVIS